MDVAQFTSKERKQARKSLLKKIDTYNKQARKSTRQQATSFPITSPSKDLAYKGIIKVTYDRGYALQTKSLLLENTTTAVEAVQQLFEALGLRGRPKDYALEERNVVTGENRIVEGMESPLNLQLNYGGHQSYMEMRVIQLRDTLSAPPLSSMSKEKRSSRGSGAAANDSESDETLSEGSNPNLIIPKEEVIDHGIAQVELTMEDALQDIPPLVHDIQERLKGISESVAVDGKPRSGLPSRRQLWDRLKPQASALVKDIRRLVDNGEFLANRHCKSSPVVKLIITLLLELITDHSRELVTVTKEMCGLRGAAKTDFDSSVSRFTQQVTYISKLVGKTNDALYSMAIIGHLLAATSPENFQSGKLTAESYFTGSKSVSGVLLFVVVSAYLGLVRAAYEEKCEYYASLATNMLRSSQRTLETIQKTDQYSTLHLHPLRSRVMDMDHKLKVAMDNLIRKVRVAASSRPPPDATPEMLQCGYSLIMSTLDFLMVAQCASLVHKVAIAGWELMQFPWVRAIAAENGGSDTETGPVRSAFADQLSSLGSDSTGSHSTGGESSVYRGTPERAAGERRSRIHNLISQRRESGDGMDALEMASSDQKLLRVSHLMSPYEQYQDSGEDVGDEQDERSSLDMRFGSHETSDAISTRSMAVSSSDTQGSTKERSAVGPSNTELENSHYAGIDAVKKLRENYNINRVIAKGAESLLLTLTQKVHLLSVLCRDKTKERYMETVEVFLDVSRQIREEVVSMEVDILIGRNMAELLDKSRPQMEKGMKELHMAASVASVCLDSSSDSESATSNLLSAASHLKDMSSKMVAEALAKVTEHKKALEEAEKIEKEFMSLMTGQRHSENESSSPKNNSDNKKLSTALKNAMARQSNSDGIVFEDIKMKPLMGGGRGWVAKEAPKVVAGTVCKLVHRLTFHRVIDSEFNEAFLLTFYSFMSPDELLNSLEERFNVKPVEELTESEMETYKIDVAIPIQLRVVYSLRRWLQLSYDDFKNHALCQKLNAFITTIQRSMPSCGKQLQSLKEANLSSGPGHLQIKSQGIAPTPLVPISLSTGVDFDLLDVNALELARQLTVTFSGLLRGVRPQEILSLGWTEEPKHELATHITQILQMSKNLSKLVCKEVMRETIDEDQSSVLSYFIQAAKSCLELKNYEAVFAIVEGLESNEVKKAAWQMVTDHLKRILAELREVVSPELDYHHYKQEICSLNQAPCVPKLEFILSELEAIDKEHSNFYQGKTELVNFQKRMKFSKAIQHIQRYQSIPYNFHTIEVMQKYLGNLKKTLTDEELDKLSTKIESFVI